MFPQKSENHLSLFLGGKSGNHHLLQKAKRNVRANARVVGGPGGKS